MRWRCWQTHPERSNAHARLQQRIRQRTAHAHSVHALRAGVLRQLDPRAECVPHASVQFAQLSRGMTAGLLGISVLLAASITPCTDGRQVPSGDADLERHGWPQRCDSPFVRPFSCGDWRPEVGGGETKMFVLLLNSFEKLTWATVGLGRLLTMTNSSLGVSLVEPCVLDSGNRRNCLCVTAIASAACRFCTCLSVAIARAVCKSYSAGPCVTRLFSTRRERSFLGRQRRLRECAAQTKL